MYYSNGMTVEKIIKQYRENKSLNQVAKNFGVPISDIMSLLLDKGGEAGKEILIQALEEISQLPVIKMAEDRMNRMSMEEIADNYHTDLKTVKRLLKQYETVIGKKLVKPINKKRRKDIDLLSSEIVEKYRSGTRVKELAIEYQCLPTAIRTRIDEYIEDTGIDIDLEHTKNFEKIKEEEKKHTNEAPIFSITKTQNDEKVEEEQEEISAEGIIKRYDKGMALPQIAKDFNTNKNTILRCLNEDGGEKGKTIVMLYLDSSKSNKITIREAVQHYDEEGLSIEQIAEDYDVDIPTVVNRLKDYEAIFGKKIIRRRWRQRRADLDLAASDIIKEYKDGVFLADIAGGHHCSTMAIRSRLDEHMEKTGEDIDKIHDRSIRQRSKSNEETEKIEKEQDSEFKIASLQSVCNIIEKYNYSFDKISEEAKIRGYIVLPEVYLKAFETVKRQKRAKETDTGEVEC